MTINQYARRHECNRTNRLLYKKTNRRKTENARNPKIIIQVYNNTITTIQWYKKARTQEHNNPRQQDHNNTITQQRTRTITQ